MKGAFYWWDDAVVAAVAFAKMSSRRHRVHRDTIGLWCVSEVGA